MLYVLLGTFFAFLGLKLAGVVDWSWWAVTAPLDAAALLTVLVVALTVAAVATAKHVARRF
jgi:hypothetical protein